MAQLSLTGGWLLLAGVALVAGCSSTIDGKPVAGPMTGPTEPSFPTSKQTASPPPAAAPQPKPSAPNGPPAGATALPPDNDGYVFIETKSGLTRCQISTDSVGCQAEFTNSPMQEGERANGISVTAEGAVQWILGNLGDIPAVAIDYLTYDAQGWTIAATNSGTRFTNDGTGHGMFVSIDKVETF